MPTTPSAVLLDVGGVFLLPSHAHIRSALSRIDHVVTDDAAIDRAHYVSVRVFPMDLESGEYMGPYWNDYLDAYARELGVDEPLLEDAIEHLRNEYVTGGLWSHLVEGSADGLRKLVDSGVPVGIVSNSDGTVEAKLEEMGVLQVGPGHGVEVRCLVDSGHVGVEKPDPKIFDYAFEILDVPREDVWYVGDTPAFDIVGARRAGLRPILMDPFGINADFGVTCVESLAGVAEMLDT
jgi:putative hydrolase of the HAD superfamily